MRTKKPARAKVKLRQKVKKEVKYFRCNFQSMIKLENQIHDNITPEHIQILKGTPFGNLFMCFYERKITMKEIVKSTDDIISIMSTYSLEKDAFKLGNKWDKLTADDVALTFGMPKRGKSVNPLPRNAKEGIESDLVQRYFSEITTLTKKDMVHAIKKTVVLKEKSDQEDFSKLVILYMATTIFFPNSLGRIAWSFIQHIENFKRMKKISWPTVVFEYLMAHVRKHHKRPVSHVSGCVIQLLYWFCEHVDIISPLQGLESEVPRIVRWSLSDLSQKMATQSLQELPDKKVSLELKNLNACERMLLHIDGDKEIKVEYEKERDETVQEKIRRLTIENTVQRKRIDYLEKMVQRLRRDGNTSIEDEEMDDENMMREEEEGYMDQDVQEEKDAEGARHCGEQNIQMQQETLGEVDEAQDELSKDNKMGEEEERIEKSTGIPFISKAEPISYREPSFQTRTQVEKRGRDETVEYDNSGKENNKRRKNDQNGVEQKEMQQENSIDANNFPSPERDPVSISLRDLSSSKVLHYLDDKQKHVVQSFFLNATKSTVAWEDKEKGIFITGSAIEDLMFGGFVDHQIIDWHAFNLPRKLPNHAAKSVFFSALALTFVRHKQVDNEKCSLVDIIENMNENVEFLFFPMNSAKTQKSQEGYHWTLLHFNCRSLEWSHYNSMLPRGNDRLSTYAVDAKKLQMRVMEVLNAQQNGKQYPVDTKLTFMVCPQQGESAVCALFVCKFMKKIACGEELTENYSKEQMEKKRAKWTYKILSDLDRSWKLKVGEQRDI